MFFHSLENKTEKYSMNSDKKDHQTKSLFHPSPSSEDDVFIDHDPTHTTSIPSMTRLLKRRQVMQKNSSSEEKKEQKIDSPLSSLSSESRPVSPSTVLIQSIPPLTLEQEASSIQKTSGVRQHPVIKKITVTKKKESFTLEDWSLHFLLQEKDPLSQSLYELKTEKNVSLLFLKVLIHPHRPDVPYFQSHACVSPQEKKTIWTGLTWDPLLLPELWNTFLKNGWVELPPPGTITFVQSQRNVMRSAFGVQSSEWFLMVRVGTSENCHGMVIILSSETLTQPLLNPIKYLAKIS